MGQGYSNTSGRHREWAKWNDQRLLDEGKITKGEYAFRQGAQDVFVGGFDNAQSILTGSETSSAKVIAKKNREEERAYQREEADKDLRLQYGDGFKGRDADGKPIIEIISGQGLIGKERQYSEEQTKILNDQVKAAEAQAKAESAQAKAADEAQSKAAETRAKEALEDDNRKRRVEQISGIAIESDAAKKRLATSRRVAVVPPPAVVTRAPEAVSRPT